MVDVTRFVPQFWGEQKNQRLLQVLKRLRELVKQRWQWWCHPLALRVWKVRNRQGSFYWRAFNPKTGHSFSSCSEVEIRLWIEQQHRY